MIAIIDHNHGLIFVPFRICVCVCVTVEDAAAGKLDAAVVPPAGHLSSSSSSSDSSSSSSSDSSSSDSSDSEAG